MVKPSLFTSFHYETGLEMEQTDLYLPGSLIPKPQYLGELRPEAATRNRKTQGERSWPLRARNQRLFQGDFKVISINF